jgi:hypothetical protein
MMDWIVRIILIIAAPITALFVSRDALNFSIIQSLVATILVAGFVLLVALWTLRRDSNERS